MQKENINFNKFDNQTLLIKSLSNNKFISSNEKNNNLRTDNIEYTGTEQQWFFKIIDESLNKFIIQNKKTGKVMNIINDKNGAKLIQSEINFGPNQQFCLLINLGGTYAIQNINSCLNLEVVENSNKDKENIIIQSTPHNLNHQRFYLLF